MPDAKLRSISASQMPALFDSSPYLSQFMLWHYFRDRTRVPGEKMTERMEWGVGIQRAILHRTARDYRLRMKYNLDEPRYLRRGRIGHTRDGSMFDPSKGRILVEAKNVDAFRWRDPSSGWSEYEAPRHMEIQLRTGMYVDRAVQGIIAALVGGNELHYYEREPNPEFFEEMKARTSAFFRSVRANKEPEPAGIPAELPMLAVLYPEADEKKVLDRFDDKEVRELLREYKYCRGQRGFFEKRLDQITPQIIALAQDCSLIVARGIELKITRSATPESTKLNEDLFEVGVKTVLRWAEMQFGPETKGWPEPLRVLAEIAAEPWIVTRKGGVRNTLTPRLRPADPPFPDDDITEAIRQDHPGGIAA